MTSEYILNIYSIHNIFIMYSWVDKWSYKKMSDFEFTAYLSNRNSKDIYKDNTVQSFTNNIM